MAEVWICKFLNKREALKHRHVQTSAADLRIGIANTYVLFYAPAQVCSVMQTPKIKQIRVENRR